MSRSRKQGNRSASSSCRNHGSCPYCSSNRTFHYTRAKAGADDALDEHIANSLILEAELITTTSEDSREIETEHAGVPTPLPNIEAKHKDT